jgi:hypothetical protein
MSNFTDSRVFKRIGAGPYLKMLAERDANDEAANRHDETPFNSVFDNSANCTEINEIVNTHSISNYYEYTATNNDICNNIIYFPRRFYLTGIDLIPIATTNLIPIATTNLIENFNSNAINTNSSKPVDNKIRYSVKKIEQREKFNFDGNVSIDFKISFKGFI